MKITLQRYRSFLALADWLSFTAAAERLHIKPFTLSPSIQNFETAIGGKLFDRDTRKLRLTAMGVECRLMARRKPKCVRSPFITKTWGESDPRNLDAARGLVVTPVNVYPQELENTSLSHPDVMDVAVFDVPEEDLGERLVAVVQLMPGASDCDGKARELQDFCKQPGGSIKTPTRVTFCLDFPRKDARLAGAFKSSVLGNRRPFCKEDLDPTVLRPAVGGGIGGDWLSFASAVDHYATPVNTVGRKVVAGRLGTLQRQGVVDGIGADVVGVPDDAHFGIGLARQPAGELVQNRPQVGLDVGSAGVERHITGNLQLELVVLRLGNRHTGALGGTLHRGLLVGHVFGPDVTTGRSHRTADHGSLGTATDHRPGDRTDTGTNGRIALRLAHVSATA